MSDTETALALARRYAAQPGISLEVAAILAIAEIEGHPLDPYAFDDAALILRAERLLIEGVAVREAIATARTELATWNRT